MHKFKTLKDLQEHLGEKGSEIVSLVDEDGEEFKMINLPKAKQKVRWKCANNSAHTSISNLQTLLLNKKERLCCRSCAISLARSNKTYESFIGDLEKEGWKMASKKSEYQNTKSVMNVICHNAHSTKISYANWTRGERSCKLCKNSQKYSLEDVKAIFKDRGCKLLEDCYIDNKTNMRYQCKCGNESTVALSNFLRKDFNKRSGCKKCSRRMTTERVVKLFEQTECALIFAYENKDPFVPLDIDGGSKVIFYEWPDFILNSTYILYKCECGNEHMTNWKAFKKGVRCYDCTKTKIENTCLDVYGVKNPFESEHFQKKAIITRLERYGVEYPMQHEEFVKKAKETNIKNHGGIHNSQIPEQKEARDKAYLDKYGAKFGFVEEHNKKGRERTREKYGVDYPFQSKEIRDRMEQKYGNKCYVHSEAGKKHMTEKYGAPNAMQCPELFEKAMKKAFTTKIYTFPSGKDVFVQGYEPFALDDLLKDGVDENDIFTGRKYVPTIKYEHEGVKRVYYPDIYVKSKNLLIEVKSLWTYNRELDKNASKFKAAKKSHKFKLWIYDKGGQRVKASP